MGRKLTSLNKDELRSLADANNVEYGDDDTKDDLVSALEAAGVSDDEERSSDQSEFSSRSFLSGETVLPDLDPETHASVYPKAAIPPNPGLQYDDSLAGKPGDAD